MNFDTWKELLRNDCIALDMLREFDGLGEDVLRILHASGIDPSVEAIVRDGINHNAPAEKMDC